MGRLSASQDMIKRMEQYVKSETVHGQFILGLCCEIVDGDYENAVKYYQEATEQNHIAAQFQLAVCYYQGKGVVANSDIASELFQKARNACM